MLDKDMNYEHLASGLKEVLENDKSAFDADRLQKYTGNLVPLMPDFYVFNCFYCHMCHFASVVFMEVMNGFAKCLL